MGESVPDHARIVAQLRAAVHADLCQLDFLFPSLVIPGKAAAR